MYEVSDLYISTLTEKTKTDRVEINIKLTNGSTLTLTDDKIIKGSLYINNQCLNNSEFEFGCTYAAECGFSFKDTIDRYILFNSTVTIDYYRKLSDGTEEKIPMGIFLIDEAEKSHSLVTVKCLDRMTLLDVPLEEQTVGTVYDLLTYLSTNCAFELAQTQAEIEALTNGTEMFSFYPDRIDSLRDCLGYLSAVTATFALFDRWGKLKLCQFQTAENWSIDDNFRIKSKFNDAETFYKGVTVRFLANQNFYPYSVIHDERGDGLILDMGDIPIVQGTPETKGMILTNIYNCLVQIKYRPCEVDYFGNPAIDLGDYVTFTEGNSLITHYYWRYRGKHTLKSVGLNPKLQAVKDKTYKQLVNLSAEVEGCKIGIYTFVNAEKYVISSDPVKVITMQYSSVQEEKTLFFGSIQVDMDCDGEVEITYYINQTLDPERTRRQYLTKGKHLLTLFDWLTTKENSRNELWVFLQPLYYESVERVQTADIDTQKNRTTTLIDTVVNGTEYVEPTPTEINRTVPTITISEGHSKGLVFGQGLATTGYIWDGTINAEDYMPENMTYTEVPSMTLATKILESLNMSTQIPTPINFEETVLTATYTAPEPLTIGNVTDTLAVGEEIVSHTITTKTDGDYSKWFVDTSSGVFKPATTYKYKRVEVDSDRGLRAEITVDTTGINVTSLEVVKK